MTPGCDIRICQAAGGYIVRPASGPINPEQMETASHVFLTLSGLVQWLNIHYGGVVMNPSLDPAPGWQPGMVTGVTIKPNATVLSQNAQQRRRWDDEFAATQGRPARFKADRETASGIREAGY